MSSKLWTAAKITAAAGAAVFVVSVYAGPETTGNVAATVVSGTAWGVGVLGGSVKYIGPGVQSGMQDAGEPSGFDGLSNEVGTAAGKQTVKKLCAVNPKPTGCA